MNFLKQPIRLFSAQCWPILLLASLLALSAPFAPSALAQDTSPILSLDPGGHTAPVTQVLFTPDGKQLITVGNDKVTRVWDVKSGDSVRAIRGEVGDGPLGKLYAGALSPDGRVLALGGFLRGASDGTFYIRLIDAHTGRILKLMSGLFKPALALAFSSDGSLLASGDGTGTVRINNVQTGESYALKGHTKDVYGVAFSPSGRQVVSASLDGTVRLWDLGSRKSRTLVGQSSGGYRCVAWSPDGHLIVAGGFDHTIHVWDGGAGAVRPSLPPQDKYINCLAFSPDGKRLAAGFGSGGSDLCPVRFWSVGADGISQAPAGQFLMHTADVQSVAFSLDGRTVASAGGLANDVYLWRVSDAKVSLHIVSTGGAAQDIAWSPDSTKITWKNATAGAPIQHTFDLANRVLMPNAGETWQGASLTQQGATLSRADSPSVVTLSSGGRIQLTRPGDVADCFTWTPDGSVVVGSTYGLSLYDKGGHLQRVFIGHTSDVLSVSVSPDGKYLASASGDQTVRIWPLDASAATDDGKVYPLMSLFVGSDREWVAWTHSGYYTCSSNGENIMGWQIDKGDDQEAAYFPASRFHDKLYRDDILAHVMETGSEDKAISMADAGRGQKTDLSKTAANIANFVPPTVEILEPTDGATVADGQVSVKVRITDPNHRHLRDLKLTDNGHILPTSADAAATIPEGEQTMTASLLPGENTLSVVVGNDAGAQSVPATVKITYGAGTPVKIGEPTLYILSIGVSQYQDSTNSLQFPAKDASDLAGLFESQQGPGKMFNKVVLTKLTDKKATREAIMKGLKALRVQAKQMGPDDYTIVFVAGHGTNDDLNQYFYAPYDIDTGDIDSSGVEWLAFSQTLAALPGKVILMLDTCHSDNVRESKVSKKDGYGQLLVATSLARFNNESPVITFASCGKGELSNESADWGNGAYTKALVEGLSGKADLNHDGVVTISELGKYLTGRVSELTKDAQHPVFGKPVSIRADLPLAVVGPLSKTASTGETLVSTAKTP